MKSKEKAIDALVDHALSIARSKRERSDETSALEWKALQAVQALLKERIGGNQRFAELMRAVDSLLAGAKNSGVDNR